MARLPYVTAASAPPAVADTLAKLPELHVISLLAHAETAFEPWLRYGGALLNDLALDPALRELVILQVGKIAANYEWVQHVPIALDAGVTQAEIDAVDQDRIGTLAEDRRAVLQYVRAFVAGEVDDQLHAALAHHLPDRQIAELCLVAGQYFGLARIMSALRIDPDPPAGPEVLLRLRG